MPETPGSVFEQTEPGFGKRPISPRFSFVVTRQQFERPIVPWAAVCPHQRASAAGLQHFFQKQQRIQARSAGRDIDVQHLQRVTIDCRPDIDVLAVDFDFRLVDGHLLSIPAVGSNKCLSR